VTIPCASRLVCALAFASGDIVFSCGGIGATPDDHTRQCAARALNVELALHPEAEVLIRERMQDMAREQGLTYEPQRPDNVQRLQMGVFPVGARIIPNPYNKIPGFSCFGKGPGAVHFFPGFPVMAWPMIEWVLARYYAALFHRAPQQERSVRIFGVQESELVALMERIERQHPRVRTFSLPSVDDPVHGRHIEIGVKGPTAARGRSLGDIAGRIARNWCKTRCRNGAKRLIRFSCKNAPRWCLSDRGERAWASGAL